jgi:hypothetical protein
VTVTALLTVEDVEEILGKPFASTAKNCHGVSLAIVKRGPFPQARVARGGCDGVGGQHSWVALGDPYDDETPIIDATLWSYRPDIQGVYVGTLFDVGHQPHGYGSIFEWGKPEHQGGPDIDLTPTFELSEEAEEFLDLLGPLDRRGWATLAHAPVLEWPAGEIFAAMDDTPQLKALVPIDILGMTTDRNPGGLYLRGA